MKRKILSCFSLFCFVFFGYSQNTTETFEGETDDGTTFSENGYSFSLTNNLLVEYIGSPASPLGSGFSRTFLDNFTNRGTGKSYSIDLSSGASEFTMHSLELYVTSNTSDYIPSGNDGTVTFTGKNNGSTVFTYTKSTGYLNNDLGSNNGYVTVDFSSDPSSDLTTSNIDQLEVTLGGAFAYIGIDDFEFGPAYVETNPPSVTTISVLNNPTTTATSVQFLVDFDENALNVTTDDFVVDATGSVTGSIIAISGSGSLYTVTVTSVSGEGTLSIDLISGNDIEDSVGNSPAPAFTSGDTHTVGRCFVETFESFSAGASSFTSNGVDFETGTSNFAVENFAGSGSGSSDYFLSNSSDVGTGKSYSISTVSSDTFTVSDLYVYLSSNASGSTPTNDGTITFVGKLAGVTAYTFTISSGFNTSFSSNEGFNYIDFSTAPSADYSDINVDEIQFTLGGSFQYIAVDDFQHCYQVLSSDPPLVQQLALVGNPEASATQVTYSLSFNEDAVNVSLDDLELVTTGSVTANLASLSGSGSSYTVTVNSITGEGSLRVNLKSGTDIEDLSGNSNVNPYTGEEHIVSDCYVETFETVTAGQNSFTNTSLNFSTSSVNFSVEELLAGGAGDSNRFLSNINDQGTSKIYSIDVSDDILVNSLALYLSSAADGGEDPTDDGTVTIKGKLNGSELYSITPSSYLTTSSGTQNGFITVDFATDGDSDYSTIRVDEIEVTLSGSFIYIALDNLQFCTSQDFIYASGSWLPQAPSGVALPEDNIVVQDGTAILNDDIQINDITVSSGATLNIGGRLTLNGDIFNNGSFVFLDNATNTGTIAAVDPTSSISGDITVQQYFGNSPSSPFEPRRAFRFVSSAVTSSTSINANWQEGATSASQDPTPTYGVHITGSSTGDNGFDESDTGNPSLFDYDNVNQSWGAVSNTNANTIIAGKAYRLFVRGDRSISLADNNANPTVTTIRSTGTMLTGDHDITDLSNVANDFNFFGNPYQSIVNMSTVLAASTNLNDEMYYIWDPFLNTRGAYVLRDFGATGTASDAYLEPGVAGFVQTLTNASTSLNFSESDKAAPVFSRANTSQQIQTENLEFKLYTFDKNERILADMAFAKYYQGGSNEILANDGYKFNNLDETMAILSGDAFLASEKRALPQEEEVLQLNISKYRNLDYEFEIKVGQFDHQVTLIDAYLNSEIVLQPGVNTISFSVDPNIEESKAADRFSVKFGSSSLSIDDFNLNNAIVYPNPVTGNTISVYLKSQSEEVNVQMFDLTGRKILDSRFKAESNNRVMVDRPAVQNGTYMLKISDSSSQSTFKVILN